MRSCFKIMKNIEQLGESYCRKYLDPWNKEKLQNNWWEALKFFFSHSFMRGRRDKLSNEYYYFTIRTLEDCFSITNGNYDSSYEGFKEQKEHFNKECILKFKKDKNIGKGNSVKHEYFKNEVVKRNPIVKLLVTPKEVEVKWENKTYNKKIFLGNDADIMMVLDVLKFISDDDKKNIYNYLRTLIMIASKISNIKSVYDELIGMRAISDKIATFIIRDIMLLNSDIKISEEDYKFAFPIDTWVIKIAEKLCCNSKDINKIKNFFIDKCKESGTSLLKVSAGIWFLGFHSLDILVEHYLGEIDVISNISAKNR